MAITIVHRKVAPEPVAAGSGVVRIMPQHSWCDRLEQFKPTKILLAGDCQCHSCLRTRDKYP